MTEKQLVDAIEEVTDVSLEIGGREATNLQRDVCDLIKDVPNGPKAQNAKIQLLGLQTLEQAMRECTLPFHQKVAEKDFLGALVRVLQRPNLDSRVRDKILRMVSSWANEFASEADLLPGFQHVFKHLQDKGFHMPGGPRMPAETDATAYKRGVDRDLKGQLATFREATILFNEMLSSCKQNDNLARNDALQTLLITLKQAAHTLQTEIERESSGDALNECIEVNDIVQAALRQYQDQLRGAPPLRPPAAGGRSAPPASGTSAVKSGRVVDHRRDESDEDEEEEDEDEDEEEEESESEDDERQRPQQGRARQTQQQQHQQQQRQAPAAGQHPQGRMMPGAAPQRPAAMHHQQQQQYPSHPQAMRPTHTQGTTPPMQATYATAAAASSTYPSQTQPQPGRPTQSLQQHQQQPSYPNYPQQATSAYHQQQQQMRPQQQQMGGGSGAVNPFGGSVSASQPQGYGGQQGVGGGYGVAGRAGNVMATAGGQQQAAGLQQGIPGYSVMGGGQGGYGSVQQGIQGLPMQGIQGFPAASAGAGRQQGAYPNQYGYQQQQQQQQQQQYTQMQQMQQRRRQPGERDDLSDLLA
ncbi:unnamed protein product [Vitrella brassicaformis CCMP3155]|uniref:VHS domain-containing protein n=1 Tax=Vitrella brassicaformis (strain CCMP3155) TaxID=1169540 RepID=A0A0G4EFE8_VITBC|nr:unnamed protein product [Vitrella brassicaformis CCMP3155]|eukprot:CEL94706.1 unnamed protein product [Vitrella brassicaformis CCMP3155]